MGLVQLAANLWLAGRRAYGRKWSFSVLFVCIFFGSVILLGRLGFLPEAPAPAASAEIPANGGPEVATGPEMPLRIEASSIGLFASVENPDSTSIAVLDESLKHGAVRYPTSARLGENGNVVLFGHSSYLPVVLNQAYKTFDGIQKLRSGDVVTVYSSDAAYTYRVRTVLKQSAAGNDGIPLAVAGRVLTLSTCDSFGAKTDRFVVVADFVESHAIPS